VGIVVNLLHQESDKRPRSGWNQKVEIRKKGNQVETIAQKEIPQGTY